MGAVENIITDNLPIWSSSVQSKSSSGRGTSSKRTLYGVKKLRELILDLAVRGLLVPQDPNDESASAIVEKAIAERRHLIASGVIKKSRRAVHQAENWDFSFPLPESWCWVALADIGHDWGQKIPDSEFTYIDVGAINKERGLIQDYNILTPENAPSRARKLIKKGSVIYSTVRPYLLNIAVIQADINPVPIASTAFAIIHPLGGISSSYVCNYLRSNIFIQYVESCQTGIAYPAINDKQFFSGLIPLPPLPEQHRIVAKVDELMALCDTLEQQQEDSIQAHETLVEALLEALTDAADADAFHSAWRRISGHFDVLFTTEHSIEKLKETILQLAVMGKLIPQDQNDEPASILLEKIAAEKEKLIHQGEIKKQRIDPLTEDDLGQARIPKGWCLTRLINVYDVRDGTHDSPKYQSTGFPLVTSKNLSSGQLNLDNVKFISRQDHEKICQRSKVDKGDILFAMIGSIGNAALVDIEPEFSIKNVALFKYYNAEYSCPSFLLRFLSFAEQQFKAESSGAVQSFVSLGKLRSFLIALPPLAEQHRIVAKVDELMTLCDELKESLQQAQQSQIHLTDAVVENAL